MTETQARYRSDAQADFEERLLKHPAFFGLYAKAYMDAGAMDSFLIWAWEHRKEVDHGPR